MTGVWKARFPGKGKLAVDAGPVRGKHTDTAFCFWHGERAVSAPCSEGGKEKCKMTEKQRKLVRLTACAALFGSVLPAAGAMHIMEGFLPPSMCILWGVIALPFLLAGYFSLKKAVSRERRSITLIAMAGAFIFVISSLKIPSVTGSCSHMTGTGLGAILFGPSAVSILGLIVLLFQAILLAHGGLTTLGATVCFVWRIQAVPQAED